MQVQIFVQLLSRRQVGSNPLRQSQLMTNRQGTSDGLSGKLHQTPYRKEPFKTRELNRRGAGLGIPTMASEKTASPARVKATMIEA
jgi:hypothetical protein